MSLRELADRNCVPCRGTEPLPRGDSVRLITGLPGWRLADILIEKEFKFKSYLEGLDFAFAVGKIAESQDHHPEILVRWRRVRITLSTHVIKGLSMNDFIMAARIELEYQKYGPR